MYSERLVGNTSGQGKDAVVPPEVRKWNLGALVFQAIWAYANLPMDRDLSNKLSDEGYSAVGKHVNFYLSLAKRGNELSWKYKRWPSLEAFLRAQRRWEAAALTLVSFFAIAFAVLAFLGLYALAKR